MRLAYNLEMEVCTENECDWKDFIALCAKGFSETPNFERDVPDATKRLRFLYEYFTYLYKTELSAGRATLICLKREREDGVKEIVYGHCSSPNKQRPSEGDISAMMAIAPSAARKRLRFDALREKAVHEEMRKLSEKMGFNTIYGDLHVGRHGFKYLPEAIRMAYKEALVRSAVDRTKPTIAYVTQRFWKKVDSLHSIDKIAHMHEECDDSRMRKCVDDPNCSDAKAFDCLFVGALPLDSNSQFLIPKIKNHFQVSSKL